MLNKPLNKEASNPTIQTERLILQQWCEEDVEPFVQLNVDSRVREYFLGLQAIKKVSPQPNFGQLA